jgi:hypothetical protein
MQYQILYKTSADTNEEFAELKNVKFLLALWFSASYWSWEVWPLSELQLSLKTKHLNSAFFYDNMNLLSELMHWSVYSIFSRNLHGA